MLVLSRQRDETIMIGDEIEITVVDIRGDKVRLGINAPKHILVHRKEVYDLIRKEKRQATQTPAAGENPPAATAPTPTTPTSPAPVAAVPQPPAKASPEK